MMEVDESTEGGESSQAVDSGEESSLCFSDNDDSISLSTESDIDYGILREEVLGQIEGSGDFMDDCKEVTVPNAKEKEKKQILPPDFLRVYNRLWRPRTVGGVVALSDSDTDSDYYNDDAVGLMCSVPTCRSRTHVKPRSRLIVSYYHLSHADFPRICHRCFIKAANFYKKIAKIGPNKCKFLINDNLAKSTNTIEICDDPEVPSASVKMIDDNSIAAEVCKNIHQHVNNVAEKYLLETKYTQFLNKLEKKIGGMTVWINELNYKLGMDDGSIVDALQAVYNSHGPSRQGARTVTVDMSIVNPDNPELVLESHEFEPLIIREPRKQLNKSGDKSAIVIDSFSDPDVAIVEENTTYTRNKPNNLPPRGMVVRNKPSVGQMVYVSTRNIESVDWVPAIIESIIINEDVLHNNQLNYTFKVAVGPTPRQGYVKEVKEDQMAYHEVSSVRIAVGNRIISVQHSSDRAASKDPPKFSSGVVAESPSSNNQYRYMIMFESMAVQYSYHDELRVICEMKEPIHHYFPKPFQWFIRKYFEQLPRRKILTVNTMDIVKVEYKGRWIDGTVTAVDGLLMEVFYRQNVPTEWLYRGSPRVLSLDLYQSKLMKAFTEGRPLKVLTRGGVVAEHDPAEVQRMKELVANKVVVQKDGDDETGSGASVSKSSDDPTVVRAVAKKTVTRPPDSLNSFSRAMGYPRIHNRSSRIPSGISNSIYSKSSRDESAGWVHHIKDLSSIMFPRPRGAHECSEVCIQWTNSTLDVCRGKNPLIIPMIFAFKRVDVTHMGGGAKQIYYESPCGIKLEDFDTLLAYLQKTKCLLSVDYFDFDPWVNVWDEFQTPPGVVIVQDLSHGKEFNAIQVVNSIDKDVPPYMNYEVNRIATEGVPLNLDPEFLTGCDCTDDCSNKMTCPCWQKTIKDYLDLIVKTNAEIGSSTDIMDYSYIGYQNKRLVEYVPSGIYECNSSCKCSHTCLNRVVQLPLKVKLQLFKTEFKGWGTRCLNDIPAGGFICVYVGSILTEKAANEDGKTYGDEYFAELDYIEVMERLMNKPGYESGPSDPELSDDEEEEEASQEDSTVSRATNSSMKLRTLRTKKEKEKVRMKRSTNQSQPPLNSSTSDADETGEGDKAASTYKPLRQLYGNHESVYIIDAKAAGNIGRYFNHSCEPNIFVQNVFVDTQDLRFPWVAFFAKQHIRAGTELTWDYQYIVDSVPGKKLYCFCRTDSCRGRLL